MRLKSFVGLLAIIKGWGEAVDFEVGVFDKGGLAPLAGDYAVGGLDVAVDWCS